MKARFKHQFLAALALVTNSKELGRAALAGPTADQAVRDEYAKIQAKTSKLSRARRARIIHIVEKEGGFI